MSGSPTGVGAVALVVLLILSAAPADAQTLRDTSVAPLPWLDGPLYLTRDSGDIDGVEQEGAVKFLRPAVNARAGAHPWLGNGTPLDAERYTPSWYTPRVWNNDLVIRNDTPASVFILLSLQAEAVLTVHLEEIRPDGTALPLAQRTVPLGALDLGPHRIDVTLPTDGAVLHAGHALRFRIDAEGTRAGTFLRYGSPDAPAGIPGLRLDVRDRDGDGLGDTTETRLGSDPFQADGDGDGHLDPIEVFAGSDPLEAASVPQETRQDSDDDGLVDAAETRFGTDPHDADSDGDGIGDGTEARHGHDPADADDTPNDRDGDTLPDVTEDLLGTDPSRRDSDGNGVSDDREDPDDDGLDNAREAAYGTDPLVADTDHDGLGDGAELAIGRDPSMALAPHERGRLGGVAPIGLALAGAAALGTLGFARRFRL